MRTGLGQVAKLLGARAEVRLTRAFRSGKARQGSRGRQSREGGLQVTVTEQQGRRVKHESGEGEMEMCDMRRQQTLFRHLSRACVFTRMKMCGVCTDVRATGECVYRAASAVCHHVRQTNPLAPPRVEAVHSHAPWYSRTPQPS